MRHNMSPATRAALSARMKALHADPEFAAANAERARERMRRLNADPEFAAANAERMRKLNADPEFAAANAERSRERLRKLHADPEFAERKKARVKQCVYCQRVGYRMEPDGEAYACHDVRACEERILRAEERA